MADGRLLMAGLHPPPKERMLSRKNAANIVWHEGHVDRDRRATLLEQEGCLIWLTGLSGSGKSTVAFTLEHALVAQGALVYVLDGDNIRHGLNANLGFSADDRTENIRRIGEVGKLFTDCGVVTVASFVSPYRDDRENVRSLLKEGDFFEVYINAPLSLCEERDPKGLYKKARVGEIPNFTGISDPYEPPENPELTINTEATTPDDAALELIDFLVKRGKIKRR